MDWFKLFTIDNALSDWPQLLNMEVCTRNSPNYFFSGQRRPNDQYCAFQLTLAGCGEFYNAGTRYDLPVGSAFLIPASDPNFSYGYPKDGVEPWQFIYINFYGCKAQVNSLLEQGGSLFEIDLNSPIIKKLKNFKSAVGNNILISQHKSLQFTSELLATLAQSRVTPAADESNVIRLAMVEIRNSVDKGLNVSTLAQSLNISREHLTRLFKRELNKTPHQCILEARLHLACRLLTETNHSCKEISFLVGDPSPAHFSTLFKRHLKQTPAEYRTSGGLLHNINKV